MANLTAPMKPAKNIYMYYLQRIFLWPFGFLSAVVACIGIALAIIFPILIFKGLRDVTGNRDDDFLNLIAEILCLATSWCPDVFSSDNDKKGSTGGGHYSYSKATSNKGPDSFREKLLGEVDYKILKAGPVSVAMSAVTSFVIYLIGLGIGYFLK